MLRATGAVQSVARSIALRCVLRPLARLRCVLLLRQCVLRRGLCRAAGRRHPFQRPLGLKRSCASCAVRCSVCSL